MEDMYYMLVAFLASDWGRVSLVLAPFLFCFSLYAIINPRGAVLLVRLWQLKGNREPGDTALLLMRLVGIILLLMVLALALFLIVGIFLYNYEYGTILSGCSETHLSAFSPRSLVCRYMERGRCVAQVCAQNND